MNMRAFLALTVVLICRSIFAQVDAANELFDNFEFSAASELYSKAKMKGLLKEEEKLKLGYCYLVLNQYNKAEALFKPISGKDAEPHVRSMYIETLKALGRTEQARTAYQELSEQAGLTIDKVWLASLDSIDNWKEHISIFEAYPLKDLNTAAAEFSPQLHINGLLYIRETRRISNESGGPALAYDHTKDFNTLQYGLDPTPRTALIYSEYAPQDTLAFKNALQLFAPNDHHLGPFCMDQERDIVYFTRSGLPELGGTNGIPWIYFGMFDILPDKVSHIKPFGTKMQLPLFEVIGEMDEADIRDEKRKLQNAENPDHNLIKQIGLYLKVIVMQDQELIEVVDSLFEAEELSGSLINAINAHIERKGDPASTKKNAEKTVFWQPKAGMFSMGTPTLSHDGRTMYFSSTMSGGYGGADLYVIRQQSGRWTEPENLGPEINTSGDELFPQLKEAKTLYFSSDGWPGYGGLDLFSSTYSQTAWNTATNVKRPFNSPGDDHGIVFEQSGNAGYFVSDRSGGTGDDDLYRFTERFARDIAEGNAEDLYKKFIAIGDALFEEYDLLDSREAYEEALAIRSEEEYPVEMIKLIDGMLHIAVDDKDNNVVFTNIYYEYNRYNITPSGAKELERLALFLIDNPDLKVKLSSYADSRGGRQFNLSLSEKRAASAKRFLIALGVEDQRIITLGEGATKFVTVCPDPNDCPEEAHARNRRTEFSIIR